MSREILLLVDALAHEKNVSKEVIFTALELALASATKKNHEEHADIHVTIDRETGAYTTARRWQYVEYDLLESSAYQFDEESEHAKGRAIGDFIEEPLDNIEFGRIGAQAAKQVILQKVREAEREQILEDFLARNESLVTGVIKRMEKGNALIEVGRLECLLPREAMIPKENLRVGDHVRAYLSRIERSGRGPQLILSRVAPEFLKRLFELEVPEIDRKSVV